MPFNGEFPLVESNNARLSAFVIPWANWLSSASIFMVTTARTIGEPLVVRRLSTVLPKSGEIGAEEVVAVAIGAISINSNFVGFIVQNGYYIIANDFAIQMWIWNGYIGYNIYRWIIKADYVIELAKLMLRVTGRLFSVPHNHYWAQIGVFFITEYFYCK